LSQHAQTAGGPVKSAEKHAQTNMEEVHDEGHGHGSFRGYMTGFVLSVILTAIPFWLVMSGTLDKSLTGFIIMGFAVAQIIVHMVFFLHMDARAEAGWNMMAMMFTVIIVVIVLAGSLWVMYHLNTNMMPDMNMNMEGQGPVTSDPAPGGNAEPASR
jgi:cytochrome o ubiquinol oxidase operon protein cyoD